MRARIGSRSIEVDEARLGELQPKKPFPIYRSKLEANYAAHLDMLKKAGAIMRWEYEPFSFKLGNGARYRPDFLIVPAVMVRPELHEVKGRWTRNKRDGMTHLRWAAQRFGDLFAFKLIEWKGHGFESHVIEP